MSRESVEGLATTIFSQYTPQFMVTFLSNTTANLTEVAKEFIHICLCGGIGDGKDRKYRGLYLTHDHMRTHLDGFDDIQQYLAASDVMMVICYRWNGILLQHISKKLVELYTTNISLKNRLNKVLRKKTVYKEIQELFNEGMLHCFFFCHRFIQKKLK